ncbi:MAG: tyrosine-type recombinase/integrase [Candidatus Sphingomonas colombiensis]|nr:tyrosine-type recombinase/integrase [Sphingomonas sp.]WEK44309.1 MAG: tyrosine-type recombinase/integrase [Sphingomonas sp.]
MKNSGLIDLFSEFPEEELEDALVQSSSGDVIDTSGDIWRIATDGVVSWTEFSIVDYRVTRALKAFVRHLIRNNAATYVVGQHKFMRLLAKEPIAGELNIAVSRDRMLDRGFFERYKEFVRGRVSEENVGFYTGGFVRWYIWATDAGFDLFDPDVASGFESLQIGGNPRGRAVLSHDINRGPLRGVEMTQLRSALKAAQAAGRLDLADLVLVWLMVALGTNPRNLVLLEEQDYIRTKLEDGQIVHELRIPRIKKRTAGERDQFRVRRLVPEIGELVAKLIARNQGAQHIDGAIRPIFRRPKPEQALLGTTHERKSYRRSPGYLGVVVKAVARDLGLRNAEGGPLHLHPRRLRYSFATRLVDEGASVQEVADALDHTSTDYVLVYFNARSDAVRNLDRALSTLLAPVAQAFLGKVIRNEDEAARAGDPSSRIMHLNKKNKKREGLGSCGEFGFCGLLAPLACYLCRDFQPWMEAPHEHVLDKLIDRRAEKLSEGADPKWTQLYDEHILAVELVIQRCDEMKAQDLAA